MTGSAHCVAYLRISSLQWRIKPSSTSSLDDTTTNKEVPYDQLLGCRAPLLLRSLSLTYDKRTIYGPERR